MPTSAAESLPRLLSLAILVGALLVSSLSAEVTVLASSGQTAPDGNGIYTANGFNGNTLVDLNESGQVAFTGQFTATSGGTSDNVTIYEIEGVSTSNLGSYSVEVSNAAGSVVSATMVVSIATPPIESWFSGASEIQPEGWRRFDWFKGFKPEGPNWIYHGRHGWLYVLAEDTSRMFLWDVALGRWMFTNAIAYPWMYAYGSGGGWVFFFEGGRPGARFFSVGIPDRSFRRMI